MQLTGRAAVWNAAAISAADSLALGLALVLSFAAALVLVPMVSAYGTNALFGDIADRLPTLAIAVAFVVWSFASKGHYTARTSFWNEARDVLGVAAAAFLLEGFLQYAARAELSRLWVAQTWIMAVPATMGLRAAARAFLLRRGVLDLPVLIFGDQAAGSFAADALSAESRLGYRVVGIVPLTADPAELKRILAAAGAKGAIVSYSERGEGHAAALVANLARLNVPYSIAIPPTGLPAASMEQRVLLGHDVVFLVRREGLMRPAARVAKRAIDIMLASSGLVIASPVMAAIAILVRRDGGAALYGHERVGRGAVPFRCLKFRSMRADSAEALERHLAADPAARREWAETRKLRNDPRVTRLGAFLRKSALDELPQLWNVLRGEMSLVGPRPVTASEIETYYGDDTESYLAVRPGLTGLWQASGRNELSYERRVALDAWYVRNWSAWLDLVIMLKTVPALLARRGAY